MSAPTTPTAAPDVSVVEKATCFSVHRGNEVVGNFAGPDCAKHARMFAAALLASAAGGPVQIGEGFFLPDGFWSGSASRVPGYLGMVEDDKANGCTIRPIYAYANSPAPVGELQGVADAELLASAKLLHNLTLGDTTVLVRAPSAEKRDAITAAGERFRAAVAATHISTEQLRQRLGEVLTEVLTDENAAPEPDWFDSREIDRVIDAILPVITKAGGAS